MINKVVFHGDSQNKLNHDVVFFSTDKNFSKDYGSVGTYLLTLNNPFHTCREKDITKLINKVGTLIDTYDDNEYTSFEEISESGLLYCDTWEIFEPHMRVIESLGYDGMIIYEGGIENYVSFDLNQYSLIKNG